MSSPTLHPDAPHRGRAPRSSCTRRGCRRRATVRLEPSTGGHWQACTAHRAALEAALYVGMPGATSGGSYVTATPIRGGRS